MPYGIRNRSRYTYEYTYMYSYWYSYMHSIPTARPLHRLCLDMFSIGSSTCLRMAIRNERAVFSRQQYSSIPAAEDFLTTNTLLWFHHAQIATAELSGRTFFLFQLRRIGAVSDFR